MITVTNKINHLVKKFAKIFCALLVFCCQNAAAAVLVKDKQWTKGTTLNVVFIDGSQSLHQQIKQIAPLWLHKTSLKFAFYDGFSKAPKQTHIRISFNSHSGSQLGNHGDYLSKFPTMNLRDLTSESISDNGSKRLILHEFGHALGLEHEYRSENWPYGTKPLEGIITDCYPKMEAIGYAKEEAKNHCFKINSPIKKQITLTTAYDERSIMNYSMDIVRKDGSRLKIKPTFTLSFLDLHAIQQWYGW